MNLHDQATAAFFLIVIFIAMTLITGCNAKDKAMQDLRNERKMEFMYREYLKDECKKGNRTAC